MFKGFKSKPKPPRADSYRDPDLSDKWLMEAEWRAQHDHFTGKNFSDRGKIIMRLVQEVHKLNKMRDE